MFAAAALDSIDFSDYRPVIPVQKDNFWLREEPVDLGPELSYLLVPCSQSPFQGRALILDPLGDLRYRTPRLPLQGPN